MRYIVFSACDTSAPLQRKLVDRIDESLQGEEVTRIDLLHPVPGACTKCDICQLVTPGLCAIDDNQNARLKSMMTGDRVIFLAPLHFGCCNSAMRNFLDRTLTLAAASTDKMTCGEKRGRHERYPELLFVGVPAIGGIGNGALFVDYVRSTPIGRLSPHSSVRVVGNEADISRFTPFDDAN